MSSNKQPATCAASWAMAESSSHLLRLNDTAPLALSASGLASLELPARIQKVIVLADADDTGEAAAQRCSQRWVHEGRSVSIARPRGGAKDFNEMLLGISAKGRKVAP